MIGPWRAVVRVKMGLDAGVTEEGWGENYAPLDPLSLGIPAGEVSPVMACRHEAKTMHPDFSRGRGGRMEVIPVAVAVAVLTGGPLPPGRIPRHIAG